MFGIAVRLLAVFALWGLALLVAATAGLPAARWEPVACAGAGATLIGWGLALSRARTRRAAAGVAAGMASEPARATV